MPHSSGRLGLRSRWYRFVLLMFEKLHFRQLLSLKTAQPKSPPVAVQLGGKINPTANPKRPVLLAPVKFNSPSGGGRRRPKDDKFQYD